MNKALVAYIPVLHEGYRKLFERHPDAQTLYIFGKDVIASYEHLVKDIRKLDPELVKKAVQSWNIFEHVEILNGSTIEKLQKEKVPLVVSDDDLTQELIQKYFKDNPVEKDTIFLRWDKRTSIEPMQISPDVRVSSEEFDKKMIGLTIEEGKKAKDWWRRIGALVVKNGKILHTVHNNYLPADQTPYDSGDPRANFKSGIHLDASLAIHAEAGLVAWAAKEGVSLKGADVYTENFPCPPCAKQLAYSGIRRLYYRTGYKVLDGESVLNGQGVEIVFVDMGGPTK
jgi:dCMP deaminase